jgi:hypothetical protein
MFTSLILHDQQPSVFNALLPFIRAVWCLIPMEATELLSGLPIWFYQGVAITCYPAIRYRFHWWSLILPGLGADLAQRLAATLRFQPQAGDRSF